MEVALYHRGWWLLTPERALWAPPLGRRGEQLVDQGLAHGELLVEFAGALASCTDDRFETDGLACEFLTHGPAEKALLVIDADFGHIPGVIADGHVFSHIGGQRGINIAQGLEPYAILLHAAGLGDRQQQQVQLFQGHRELGKKAVGAPAGVWRYTGGTVGGLMVLMEHKVLEGLGEALQIQPWPDLGGVSGRGIARQPRKQALIHGVEEAFDAAATTGLTNLGKDRLDFEVGTDLFEVLRRKIRTVISIQDPWNPADLPCRLGLAPDGLAEGERGVEGAGRLKGHHVAGHRTTIIIQDDREPRFPGLALLIGEQHVQQGMVGLPDGIRRLRLTAVEEVEGLVIGLAAVMR